MCDDPCAKSVNCPMAHTADVLGKQRLNCAVYARINGVCGVGGIGTWKKADGVAEYLKVYILYEWRIDCGDVVV